MYLQLAGPAPLDTAENPLAPGAKPYSYDAFYLGQTAAPILLPDALYKPRVGNFLDGLKTLKNLYQDFASGRKPTPADVAARPSSAQMPSRGVQRSSPIRPMGDPITIAAAVKFIAAVIPAIQAVIGGLSATLVNNNITGLYNQNAYNVQNLNRMTVRELSLQIQNLDNAIATTPRVNFVRAMALGQIRLIYQQRFDAISGTAALGALPGWVLPAALGLGAYLLIRRK
jgi:hypothetical protein